MKNAMLEVLIRDILIYLFISINILFFTRKRRDTFKNFLLKIDKNSKFFLITLLTVIILNAITTFGIKLYLNHSQQYQILLLIKSTSRNLVMLYLVFILPFFEELIFRKVIFYSIDQKVGMFQFLKGNSAILAYIISVFMFAILHVLHPLVHGEYLKAMIMLVPYCVIGAGCSFAYRKTESIYSAIIIHIINNLIGFMVI